MISRRNSVIWAAGTFVTAATCARGTGWPSFWMPLPNAVGTETDASLGMVRTAVH